MSKRNLTDALAGRASGKAERGDVERAKEAATGRASEPTVKFNANVPESLHEAFKATCERKGHTMTWVLHRMMETYVEENA